MPHAAYLTSDDLGLLRTMAMTEGVLGASRAFGISRHAVAALLAGAPVRAGTIALAAARIAASRASIPSEPPHAA